VAVVVAVRTLLELGSDPESPDEKGRTPADALLWRTSPLGGRGIFFTERGCEG
jgi:hypothetical protein